MFRGVARGVVIVCSTAAFRRRRESAFRLELGQNLRIRFLKREVGSTSKTRVMSLIKLVEKRLHALDLALRFGTLSQTDTPPSSA